LEDKLKNKNPNNLKTALALFFLGGFGLNYLLNGQGGYDGLQEYIELSVFHGSIWVALWMGNGFIADLWEFKFPWTKAPTIRFFLTLFSALIYTVLAFLLLNFAYVFYRFGTSFSEFLPQLDKSFFYTVVAITMIIHLFMHGISFLGYWKESELEAERLKMENLSSKYETLKNQVNPHFLFNSLNVLSNLVYKDQDVAAKFIKQMSKVYRYVLDTKDKEVVPLRTELEALDAFVFLSKMRFGDNFHVNINLPRNEDIMVAPLTLQMLVENAIKHNVISKAKPLKIELNLEDDTFIIVQNNRQKKSSHIESSGIGIPNIQARYKYISQKDISVIESNDYFTVKIPIVKFQA